MIQTGLKQATIAYRVAAPSGEPLDINGQLISISGRKQAIALLTGTPNPNPALYEVQEYFNSGGLIGGEITVVGSPDCPPSFFSITPASILLSPTNLTAVLTVVCSGGWALLSAIGPSITLSKTSGTGNATITVTRTATAGEGDLIFKAVGIATTIKIHYVNAEADAWILETGLWRNYKLWKNDGLWIY